MCVCVCHVRMRARVGGCGCVKKLNYCWHIKVREFEMCLVDKYTSCDYSSVVGTYRASTKALEFTLSITKWKFCMTFPMIFCWKCIPAHRRHWVWAPASSSSEVETSLDYTVSSSPACTTRWDSGLNNNNEWLCTVTISPEVLKAHWTFEWSILF